jgi:hypothetical protein
MPGSPTTIPTILESAFEAMNGGDPEPLIAAYATHDVVLIGTDEADWHERTDAIAAALRAEAGHVRADWDLRPVELGDDALLLVGRISFVLSDGTVIPARATHVLRREGTDWRIAHSHLSVARSE